MHNLAPAATGSAIAASRVGELGTILGIWAHPDDEAYLSGGLMALARDAGSRVVCVTATHGERGTPDPVTWPPARLAAERTVEMARCLSILGVAEHHWLGYGDGACQAVPANEPVGRLCELIEEIDPDTVLTFGPDGITGHPDHQTVGSWAAAAFDRAAPRGARLLQAAIPDRRAVRWDALHENLSVFDEGYPLPVPVGRLAVDLVLDPATVERKVRALKAQATQTTSLIDIMGLETYTEWVIEESFVARTRA